MTSNPFWKRVVNRTWNFGHYGTTATAFTPSLNKSWIAGANGHFECYLVVLLHIIVVAQTLLEHLLKGD